VEAADFDSSLHLGLAFLVLDLRFSSSQCSLAIWIDLSRSDSASKNRDGFLRPCASERVDDRFGTPCRTLHQLCNRQPKRHSRILVAETMRHLCLCGKASNRVVKDKQPFATPSSHLALHHRLQGVPLQRRRPFAPRRLAYRVG